MRRHPLAGCRHKLGWAWEHLYALESEVYSWSETTRECTTWSQFHPEANIVAVYAQVATPPLRWGVMVGNIVHNLRSALDQLVWQLVFANGETPRAGMRGNSFPIFPNEVDFEAKTRYSLRGVHPTDRAKIKRLQPYERPNGLEPEDNPLVGIDFLWNQDKHRAMEVLAFGLSETVEASLRAYEDVERFVEIRFIPGPIENNAVIAWAEVVPSGPYPKVAAEGFLPTKVAFGSGQVLIPNLTNMVQSTINVVDSFGPAFGATGSAMGRAQPLAPRFPAGLGGRKARDIARRI